MKSLLKRREASLLLVLLIVVAVVTLRARAFLTPGNLEDILKDISILLIVSIAQFLVILTGGIDLSVASTMGFTGMGVALLNRAHPEIPLVLVVLVALAIGLCFGCFNGMLVSVFNIPPMITTLGTMSIYRGFVIVISGGKWVSADQMSVAFRTFPQNRLLGAPNIVTVAFLIFVVFALVLHFSRTGREIYGVGGNRVAAQYVGINVKKVDFLVFALSGVLSGLAGYLLVAFYASAANDSASGLEMQTVAACIIGGVSFLGGSGSIVGVLLGAVFLGIVKNALTVIRVSAFWQVAIQGIVILFAIITGTLLDRRSQESMLKRRVP